jgi:glycosyltransferase involved in cell wall biosynthesis
MNKKVSIIIPAYNEENQIKQTIEAFEKQNYRNKEIIVVVNNTTDNTYEIARKYADKTLNFKGAIGVCAARNRGAESASGDVFIFSDADSQLPDGALKKIIQALDENSFGSTLGRGDNNSIKGRLFFFFKNWIHRLGIYQGVVDGVFLCHRKIFEKSGGFDEAIKIAEFKDIIGRMKDAGGKYKLMRDCYAIVSLRRYEEKGYLDILSFWMKWKITSIFKKDNKLSGQYFGQSKNEQVSKNKSRKRVKNNKRAR